MSYILACFLLLAFERVFLGKEKRDENDGDFNH